MARPGTIQPGEVRNPKGRPKGSVIKDVRELARQYTSEAIERLVDWMRTDNAKASPLACNLLLNRGWGKAEQPISGDLNVHIKRVVLDDQSPN